MAAEHDTMANNALFMPVEANRPAKRAVMIPVRKASWVSTSIATSKAAAAKGMAKFHIAGSLNGGPDWDIQAAMLSPNVKPTLINAVWIRIAEPTSANALCLPSVRTPRELLCSVNFQPAQ